MYNLEEIKREFITVINNSQGIDNPKVDMLFDYWYDCNHAAACKCYRRACG